MHSEYWYKVRKTLSNRNEYLHQRIRFLDSLPKKQHGHVFPNTFSYNRTFKEIDDINDVLRAIIRLQEWYIDDVCPVCGEAIGFNHYERHHTSYYPEITTTVHKKCHTAIHHTNSYTYLRPPDGDGKDFYNNVKKPDNWISSGIIIANIFAPASCYPPPNLNWNRAAKTQINIKYQIRRNMHPNTRFMIQRVK